MCNAAAQRMMDRTAEELIGKILWEEYPESIGTATEIHYRRAMAERTSITFENYNAPLHRWFDVRAYPARDGGLSLEARVQKRYLSNDILAEPFRAVLLGETINSCWIYARIDRSTQQNDGRGHIGIAYFLHK